MKKALHALLALVAVMTMAFNSSAQLANGTIAPNWTMTDINDVEHTLYDYLDDGYTVYLEFSATWCPPCWSFHSSGTLKDVWEDHGPMGWEGVSENTTDDVMIIFIEGDPDTTLDNLNGVNNGEGTQGDWVTGTPFPIIDDAAQTNIYQIAGWPTLYKVCPNRQITDIPFPFSTDPQDHYDEIGSCAVATSDADGSIMEYTGDVVACGAGGAEISVTIQNLGFEELTDATIVVSGDADLSYPWSGSLMTYEIEEVVVGTVPAGDLDLDIEVIVTDDMVATNNSVATSIALAVDATTRIRVSGTSDNWPQETSWEIFDENGASVATGNTGVIDPGLGSYDAVNFWETYYLPATGCYSFVMYDRFGDGMNGGTQWNGADGNGNYMVEAIDDNDNVYSVIASHDGSTTFFDLEDAFEASVLTSVEDAELVSEFKLFPNPTNGVANVFYTLSEASDVSVVVYNTLGAVAYTKDLGTVSTGLNTLEINFEGMDAGLYFVNLTANDRVVTKKVTVTK